MNWLAYNAISVFGAVGMSIVIFFDLYYPNPQTTNSTFAAYAGALTVVACVVGALYGAIQYRKENR